MVIPAIPPPPDTRTNFEGDRNLATDLPKMAPLATVENSHDGLQSTVGLYWKTFDEEDVVSPENDMDGSSSESSDEDQFMETLPEQDNVPGEKVNGWNGVKMADGSAFQNLNGGNPLMSGLGTKTYPQQNSGVFYNELQPLPPQTEKNNNFKSKGTSSDVRNAIQTDF